MSSDPRLLSLADSTLVHISTYEPLGAVRVEVGRGGVVLDLDLSPADIDRIVTELLLRKMALTQPAPAFVAVAA